MTILETILEKNILPLTSVGIPEWEETIWIKTLCVADKSKIEDEFSGKKEVKSLTFRERVLTKTVCDADGGEIFKPEHVGALRSDVAERLFERALELNGWSKRDRKDLEQAEKN
jgi:hypothetical protein